MPKLLDTIIHVYWGNWVILYHINKIVKMKLILKFMIKDGKGNLRKKINRMIKFLLIIQNFINLYFKKNYELIVIIFSKWGG